MNNKIGKRKRKLLAGRGRQVSAKADSVKPFYHGGNAGLDVGGYILPPAVTGAPQNGNVPFHIRGNAWVYVVRNLVEAAPWAAHHQSPVIYEVEPEGALENDPDVKKPGLSFRAHKAKIVAIHQIPPDMLRAARNLLLR